MMEEEEVIIQSKDYSKIFVSHPQRIWSPPKERSQASKNARIGEKHFRALEQTTSSTTESQGSARCLLPCSLLAVLLEALKRHLLWSNALQQQQLQLQLHHALAIKVGMFLVTTATSMAPTRRVGSTQRSTARKRAVTWPLSTHLPFKTTC